VSEDQEESIKMPHLPVHMALAWTEAPLAWLVPVREEWDTG